MQSNADAAIRATLKHEGGFVDHPRDPGGATNKGITLATFRRLVKPDGTVADLKKLTTEQAIVAYRKGFWATVMGDQLPAGVDFAVFDYGVNSGPARAVKALQTIVGAKADGVVGPKTLAAVEATDETDLIMELCAQRLAFVKRLKTWPTFGRGWESRIAGVRKLALEMASAQPVAVPDEPTQPEPETPASEAPTGFRLNPAKLLLWAGGIVAVIWAVNAVRSLFS